MQDIILDVGNNSKNILPVPYSRPPVPSTPSPNNYGSSPYALGVSEVPNRKNDKLQYCNFLQPSPRDQRLNVPYEGAKDCPTFDAKPYNKDSCYLLDSKAQGTVGIVCNQAGGSDNADFYRGNQFGVDYPLDQDLDNKKKLEYTVEQPVQIPLEMQNQLMLYDRNTFYPEPSFPLRGNKDYITYPLVQNYTENGMPTYNYPYKSMNPIFNDPTQTIDPSQIKDVTENFENDSGKRGRNLFVILLLIIFLLFLFMK